LKRKQLHAALHTKLTWRKQDSSGSSANTTALTLTEWHGAPTHTHTHTTVYWI